MSKLLMVLCVLVAFEISFSSGTIAELEKNEEPILCSRENCPVGQICQDGKCHPAPRLRRNAAISSKKKIRAKRDLGELGFWDDPCVTDYDCVYYLGCHTVKYICVDWEDVDS